MVNFATCDILQNSLNLKLLFRVNFKVEPSPLGDLF